MVEKGESDGGQEEGETRGGSSAFAIEEEEEGRFVVKMGEDSLVGLGGREGAIRGIGEREEERGGI